MTYRIAVLVGSLRRESFNRQLAAALAKLVPPGFEFAQVRIADLDVLTLGQPEIYLQHRSGFCVADGSIAADDTNQFLRKFMERFAAFVQEHADRVANR